MIKQVSKEPLIYCLFLAGDEQEHKNCYFILDDGAALVIDPPVYRPDLLQEFKKTWDELVSGSPEADIVFTHAHGELSSQKGKIPVPFRHIYITEEEYANLKENNQVSYKRNRFRREGFPPGELKELFSRVNKQPVGEACVPSLLLPGDLLQVGRYSLKCIFTPGPTKGHCCLYMEKERLLFSGLLLPEKDMPDIDMWKSKASPLEIMLDSLEEISAYPLDQVFPAKGSPFSDGGLRAEEIVNHCFMRLVEMYQLVSDHPGETAYELSFRFEHEEVENIRQQWFRMKDTLASLIMLRRNKYVASAQKDNCIYNYPGSSRFSDVIYTERFKGKALSF